MNYRLVHYKKANKAIFCDPNPYDAEQGWKMEQKTLKPVWPCTSFFLLILLLTRKTVEEVKDDREREIEYNEILNDEE